MDVFEALADGNRRRIIERLGENELTAGAIVDALGLSQPNVSKHLRALRDCGLVSVRKDAQRRMYKLEAAKLAELDLWLRPYRKKWAGRLDALERHLRKRK